MECGAMSFIHELTNDLLPKHFALAYAVAADKHDVVLCGHNVKHLQELCDVASDITHETEKFGFINNTAAI